MLCNEKFRATENLKNSSYLSAESAGKLTC